MNIDILHEFIDLSKTLNFTDTANRLFISRTTLSKHISALEDELGTELFQRSTHAVSLTEAGKKLVQYMEPVMAQYDDALSSFKSELIYTQNLRIGFLDAAYHNYMINAVTSIKSKYKNLNLSMRSYELGDLRSALNDDEIDLALDVLFYEDLINPANYQFTTFREERLAALLPDTHPLTKKNPLYIKDLLSDALILPNHKIYPGFAHTISRKIASIQGNTSFKPFGEYSHIDAISILVESANAISIVPQHCNVYPHQNLLFIPLQDEEAVITLAARWKKENRNPIIEPFVNLLTQSFNDKSIV